MSEEDSGAGETAEAGSADNDADNDSAVESSGGPADEPAAGLGDLGRIDDADERIAAARLSSIEAGRRKAGVMGAAAAGAMLGLRDIYEGPPKEDDIVIVSEASGDPGDIDRDGIEGTVEDVDYWAPPPGPPAHPDEASTTG